MTSGQADDTMGSPRRIVVALPNRAIDSPNGLEQFFRVGRPTSIPENGRLRFSQKKKHWSLHFIPKKELVAHVQEEEPNYIAPTNGILLAEADAGEGWLNIWPLNTTRFGDYPSARSGRSNETNPRGSLRLIVTSPSNSVTLGGVRRTDDTEGNEPVPR